MMRPRGTFTEGRSPFGPVRVGEAVWQSQSANNNSNTTRLSVDTASTSHPFIKAEKRIIIYTITFFLCRIITADVVSVCFPHIVFILMFRATTWTLRSLLTLVKREVGQVKNRFSRVCIHWLNYKTSVYLNIA